MTIKVKSRPESVSDMLSPAEAARIIGVSPEFLAKDRHEARQNGTPPKVPYVSLGHRTVRYHRADVQGFLEANRVA